MKNKVFKIKGCYSLEYTLVIKDYEIQRDYIIGLLKYYNYDNISIGMDSYQQFTHWIGNCILYKVFSNFGDASVTAKSVYDHLDETIGLGEDFVLDIIQLPLVNNMKFELAYDVIEGDYDSNVYTKII